VVPRLISVGHRFSDVV